MQLIGYLGLFAVCATAVTSLSVALYLTLPKAVLQHAEHHGRFQGLSNQETLAGGTRAGAPPVAGLQLATRPS